MAIMEWASPRDAADERTDAPPGASFWAVRGAGYALLLATTTLAGGCSASVDARPSTPSEATGTVIMDWTIDGTKDPGQCAASGASQFDVSLYGSNGALAGQWVQDCAALSTTIGGLFSDTYTGQTTLVDPTGRPRTTSVQLTPFDVVPGTVATIPVDFPANSFF
jgi:hypothetical protein